MFQYCCSVTGRTLRRAVFLRIHRFVGVILAGVLLTACVPGNTSTGNHTEVDKTVTLLVHNSFPNAAFQEAASNATGLQVQVVSAGAGAEMTSQLLLTQGAPVADAVFGVDHVFASRLIDAQTLEPVRLSRPLPQRATEFAAQLMPAASVSSDDHATVETFPLLPVTLGASCINIDVEWFTERGIAEPARYEDLIQERYRGLTVLLDPTTSSTGASFFLGTVAYFGEDGFAEYWQRLAANEVRFEQGWGEAYNGHFTQGGGDGTFPIVLSYSSSPAWTLTGDESRSTTQALLDTCSSQLEYAGVLRGAKNPEGAARVIDYLLSREFQDTVAETMYVYPIDADAHVPESWQHFAPLPETPNNLSPSEIGAGRESWLKLWGEATGL